MHIIKQLSEDEFVIKMDDYDLNTKDTLKIAHDYIQFGGNIGIQTNSAEIDKVEGKFASCINQVFCYGDVQIPIREFVQVIMPLLESSEYTKKEHLLTTDGKPNYTFHNEILFYKNKVYVKPVNKSDFTVLDRDVYNYLTKQK